MTKADLIDTLVETFGTSTLGSNGYSQTECAELVEIFLDSIKESLAAGHDVKISGFGTWHLAGAGERGAYGEESSDRGVAADLCPAGGYFSG